MFEKQEIAGRLRSFVWVDCGQRDIRLRRRVASRFEDELAARRLRPSASPVPSRDFGETSTRAQ